MESPCRNSHLNNLKPIFIMKKDFLISGEAMPTNMEGMLMVEQFLQDNYLFRRNALNGKLEFANKPAGEEPASYRPLSQEALNSIVLRAMREEVCEKGSPKSEIDLYVHSEEVPVFNPVQNYLDNLPQWDGHNYVADLISRLPGISTEQAAFLAKWFRSAVAHWLQLDTLHGNECVPTLIGAQGCGKTTFFRRLLPPSLREYYLDHLNLSNKFDKEMALTNNLIVNLDELDAIRPSQHSNLKQTLSKNKVNSRPIYGTAQEDKPRFASFVATTNNPHPLTDVTGNRRYICMTIPKGLFIDNTGVINYEQLYAQLKHEVTVLNAPYWFSNEEVDRIQELNQEFVEQKDMAEMVKVCFRKPEEGETPQSLNAVQVLERMQADFPSLKIDRSARISLGQAMKELGFEHLSPKNVPHYQVVPLRAA